MLGPTGMLLMRSFADLSLCCVFVDSVYIPAIFVLNKIDAISIEELDLLYKVCSWMTA